MASQEQEQNRNEQATPFKLKEARDRGVVAKSVELTSAALVLMAVAVFYAFGGGLIQRQLQLDAALLSRAHNFGFSETAAIQWLTTVLLGTLGVLAPLFAALIVVALIAGFLQAGPVFSFEPLKPDFDRINPASGFRKLVSMRLLFETVKNLLKLVVLGYAIMSVLQALLPVLLGLGQGDQHSLLRTGFDAVTELGLKLGGVLLLIALLDAGYVRWDYRRKMMMSRRELKEEQKRREGDPKIKARIRELQKEMRKRSRALSRVPDADVLITNPQHIAVALSYKSPEMRAPHVIAKGAGELAVHMRSLARRNGVPVVANRRLARLLFLDAELDQPIPQEEYRAVARIVAWAYAVREGRRIPVLPVSTAHA